MATRPEKSLALQINVQLSGQEAPPEMAAYLFTHQGKLVGSAAVQKGGARVELPTELDGRTVELVLGPPLPKDGPAPDLGALVRAGAYKDVVRVLRERPEITLKVPIAVLPLWCICVVRGRVVKRMTLPNGSVVERPVCNTRVHVCEVDRIRLVIDRLPELDLKRLRDDLLDKLHEIPVRIPFPIPEPDPGPIRVGGMRAMATNRSASASASASVAAESLPATEQLTLATLAQPHSLAHLRSGLKVLSPYIPALLCDLPYLWSYLRSDCVLTLHGDAQGRFSGLLFHDCKDQPDIYVWVEQFRNGAWTTVYRPSLGCGTHWDYACGSEIVINAPSAEPCEDPAYDLPPGVTLFVVPWAIGNAGIWGIPPGAPAAPDGMVRADGLINYNGGGSLGLLLDAPFGGTLNFIHDDSWFIPSGGTPITHYRYSVRRHSATANTGPSDSSWTPLLTPLARGYRLEYSDRLPTYQAFPVGPETRGTQAGLYRFKPQQSPNPGGTVVASEWTSGNLSEVAASWNTLDSAPPLSDSNTVDDAGAFDVKIEVFDNNGVQILPGPATFQFLGRNAAGTDTRLSTAAEVVAGAYVMQVHLDNNGTTAELPQPDIAGVGPNPDCGFLRYDDGDLVSLRFRASHPNDRAVFGFGVVRGSNTLGVASTTAPYVEVASATAPTTGSSYSKQPDGRYRHDFSPAELVGPCVNAAFAANLGVYGKATNGYQRLGYDASRLIAFALAQRGT